MTRLYVLELFGKKYYVGLSDQFARRLAQHIRGEGSKFSKLHGFRACVLSMGPNCTESSIRTYTFNIRALAKLAGHQTVPMHSRWINKELLAKVKKKTLGQQKKLTIAGAKA